MSGVLLVVIGLVLYWRTGHFWRAAFGSAVGGLATLLLIHFTGAFTGVSLALNWWNLLLAVFMGAPGVLVMLLLPLLLM